MSKALRPDNQTIVAKPTKDLFINMLVKDITLRDAIGDLVDNSVDAAKSIAQNSRKLEGFKIDIKIDVDSFEISDNCSGLEVEDARSNAFYFGKPDGYETGKHTIGQFGIGMKRAFFKIGNYIKVASTAQTSTFEMHIDVTEWKKQPEWNLKFDKVKENLNNQLSKLGLSITISQLQGDTKEKFTDKQFLNSLKHEIALEHLYSIGQGLEIRINNELLKSHTLTLIYDKKKGIVPAYWKHKFRDGLLAEVITGVSDDIGAEGGWYIFCNDRLILGPDTTEITGWSGAGSKELPRYHDQFYRFRGYVFFNADNSARLPWNTSKTGMNLDSPDWLYVRSQMILMGKQVKKLMDDLKKEREKGNPEQNQKLNNIVKYSQVTPINEVMLHKSSLPEIYKYPEDKLTVATSKRKTGTKMTIYKPESVVKKTMTYFKVKDADSAAEMAFDYFYSNEIGG